MSRVAAKFVLPAFILVAASAAWAQQPAPKPRSPGEIAAASRHMAEKQETCRLEAQERKLGFFKRRAFMRGCMNMRP
jgi:hypothetical protein